MRGSKSLRVLLVALLAFVIICFIWQFVAIPLRLARNGKIVQHLVERLEARFPEIRFGGAASYESEVISITVTNCLDEAEQQEVETWLRRQKIELKIAPHIRLRFANDGLDQEIILQ